MKFSREHQVKAGKASAASPNHNTKRLDHMNKMREAGKESPNANWKDLTHVKNMQTAAYESPNYHAKQTHTCPHCGAIGKGNLMFFWHFNNCKYLIAEL